MAETFKRRAPSQWGEGAVLKEEILAAAARLLAESGREEALSLRAVAREVGISAPSVYLHFKDRSELVATVTLRACEKLVAELRETRVRAADRGPREALRTMGRRYCTFALENPRRYRLMFGVERITGPREQGAGHPVTLVLGAWEEALAALPPPPRGRMDGSQDALLLWSALHGIVTIAMALPFEADPDGLARRADELLARIVAG
ncbi:MULTISPECIES: TetR/AcrR family transcriptional regulator [Streptomyces]|uniref:TetR/AcrR family transcriptional regulator n=1 Tax=Streptomyces TaxID=1883 RepID=UPI0033E92EF5